MIKQILTVLAPVALLTSAAAIPAMAADKNAVLYPASTGWADISAGWGQNNSSNQWNSWSSSGFWGEARVGTAFNGMPLQIDLSHDSTSDCTTCFERRTDVAAHLGLMTMPGSSIGVMIAFGTQGRELLDYDDQTFTTIAAEGAWGLSALGGARLVAQGGFVSASHGGNATYVHALLQAALSSNVLVSAGIGFANTSDDERYVRYGAQGEMLLSPMFSAFIRWDGEQKTEGSYQRTDNRVLFGGTLRVNQPGLGSVSPFHDFNPMTGINGDFRAD